MRILHLDSGREMRGGQWQVLYLLRGLRDRGHQSTLLAPEGSPLGVRAAAEGFPTQTLSVARIYTLSRQVEITHAHCARSHTLAALAWAPRLVVSRRVAFAVSRSLPSRWKYARAALYIAVSAYVEQRLAEAGVRRERIRVVYDGVPPLALLERGPRIVAPESSDPRKGSQLLSRAATAAGLEVVFSSDLAGDLPGAGMLVYLSYEEGLGSAVLMAHAARVPVVASRTGGLTEAVEHNRTGLLVENQASRVAAAMRRLIEDPALAARLAAAGYQDYLRRFHPDAMVEGTLECYRQVEGA